MPSLYLTSALGLLSLLPAAQAGWNPNSKDNIVVYWGKYIKLQKMWKMGRLQSQEIKSLYDSETNEPSNV